MPLLGNAAHRGKWFAQGRPQGNGTFFVLMVKIIGRKFGGGGCVTELEGWRQHRGDKGYPCVEAGCVEHSCLVSESWKGLSCSGAGSSMPSGRQGRAAVY